LHIGLNLPPKDNLQKEDKSSAPKVSFIRRFHCTHVQWETWKVPIPVVLHSHATVLCVSILFLFHSVQITLIVCMCSYIHGGIPFCFASVQEISHENY